MTFSLFHPIDWQPLIVGGTVGFTVFVYCFILIKWVQHGRGGVEDHTSVKHK